MEKIQGIYKIRNCLNGKVYIGQSIDIKNRFQSHKDILKIKYNHPLYNSMRKYGIINFEFIIVEEINNVLLLDEREQYWMEHYQSYLSEYGYNLRKDCRTNKGLKFSEETKQKHRDYLSDPEIRKKLSKSVKKTVNSPKFKEQFKKLMKKVTNTPKHKKKCSERQKKLCKNPEYIKNLSEKSKENWKDKEWRDNCLTKQKEVLQTLEYRKQNSERLKNLWQDSEYRNKMLEARKHSEERRIQTIEDKKLSDSTYLSKIIEQRKQTRINNGTTKIHLIDKDKVKQLYLEENYRLEDVAKILKVSFGLLAKFVRINELQKPKSLYSKVKPKLSDVQIMSV